MAVYQSQVMKRKGPRCRRRALRWWWMILVLGMIAGCLDSSKQGHIKESTVSVQERPITAAEPKPQEAPRVGKQRPETKIAALPAPVGVPAVPDRTVRTEPLNGYRTPAEYLLILNDRFPEAVVAVSLPLSYLKHPEKRYPLVIAFGGAGECIRNPRDGALAWIHYYRADEAEAALTSNVLHEADFRHLAHKAEIDSFNRRLAAPPYDGVILACPSSPPLERGLEKEDPGYEAFIVQDLVPELLRRYRVMDRGMGVDGVSMGGARAMYYGLKYPNLFFSIGSSQGAFHSFLPKYQGTYRQESGNTPAQAHPTRYQRQRSLSSIGFGHEGTAGNRGNSRFLSEAYGST